VKNLLVVLLSILSLRISAQSSIYILGVANIPISDVTVQSADHSFSAMSDENGFVRLSNKLLPTSLLKITRIGYESKSIIISELLFEKGGAIVHLEPKISSLSEVVVKASSRAGVFKTISDLDIHVRPINNSQEVLRMVPGLFIGQHAGGGKSEQIFLRGFDLDHGTDINITVEGLPVNMVSHAHGQGYADLHWVIPEMIDKVNFNKGPYFADKGNLTTAGYVDFKLKNHLENNFVKIEAGQFQTVRAITGINILRNSQTIKKRSLILAGELSKTRGYFESPQHFIRYNALLKYHGPIGSASTLTAMVTAFTSKWNASGQIPDRAVEDGSIGFFGAIDNTEGGNTSRYNASIEVLTNLNDGGKIRNQVYFTKNKFTLYSNFTFFKFDPINGDQIRQAENRNLMGYNGSYQNDHDLGKLHLQTNSGIQLRYDIIHNLELTRTKERVLNTASLMLGDVNEMNLSAYYSEKWEPNNKIDLTLGLRADYFSNRYLDKLAFDTLRSSTKFLSPKATLNYKINDRAQLYWYAGKGFHSNDTRVAVQQNGKKVVPPGWGSDIGGIFKLANKLVFQSAIWILYLDQEFVYVGDEGVVEAGGKSRRIGIDASIRYELLKNLFADIDFNASNPRLIQEPAGLNFAPLAPRITSVGGFTYRKQLGWNGSLRYRYMGNRPANEDYSVIANGYFIVDASVNYATKKWEAGIAIQNLFNTRWKETQFDTESRLQNEAQPVSEIHFTPGTPFFARVSLVRFF
jgi:outer membrane cobalamin receptor